MHYLPCGSLQIDLLSLHVRVEDVQVFLVIFLLFIEFINNACDCAEEVSKGYA